jgi:hypothetical protein
MVVGNQQPIVRIAQLPPSVTSRPIWPIPFGRFLGAGPGQHEIYPIRTGKYIRLMSRFGTIARI